jgi:hypothetical protein
MKEPAKTQFSIGDESVYLRIAQFEKGLEQKRLSDGRCWKGVKVKSQTA